MSLQKPPSMPIHNSEIADYFSRLADLLEVEGANEFRVRAYRNAARSIGSYGKNMADLVEQDEDLSRLPNIGEDLAGKIQTIVETGKLPLLEEVEARTPAALSELMRIEGLGPKRVKALYDELQVQTLQDLEQAARDHSIRQLSGFGKKTEQTILERVQRYSGAEQRIKLIEAEDIAGPLVAYLRNNKGLKDIVIAGSYRRCKATVGDLDILVTARRDSTIMDDFVSYEEVQEIVSQGKTRSTVRLRAGLSVDLRVVPEVSYGAALHYFTGSKAHNIAVRKIGVNKGYKINEYGVFEDDERIAGRTEQEVYDAVGLPYIEPELREDRGEVEAARQGKLPSLIELEDIRGDLHCHTKATDGHHSLEQMARAGRERGYDYISINDHSRQVTVAKGLDKKRLREQIEAIDRLNDRLEDIVVLKSIELDILEDGTLDLPDDILKQLDLTVCSVHYKSDLDRNKQTERVLRAMDNPYFNILAHPTGRLINEREPYEIDLERVMEGALDRGCFLELNAHPDRLDLTDAAAKTAKEMGLKLAISTDAHADSDLAFMKFGIDQGRRGWLEADDVINTRPLDELRKLLKRK